MATKVVVGCQDETDLVVWLVYSDYNKVPAMAAGFWASSTVEYGRFGFSGDRIRKRKERVFQLSAG